MAAEAGARTLGILAGGGDLPAKIIAACEASRRPYAVFAILGEADNPGVLAKARAQLPIGSFGKAVALLKEAACQDVLLAGRVGRPDFAALKLDWGGVKIIPKLIAAARHGDDALLKAVGAALEAEGLRLIGADEVARHLIAPAGALGRHAPDAMAQSDIARGIGVVEALGPFDVGQGAIVCEGLVLAIEAAEGTDEMLVRCARLPGRLRGSAARRKGVLVKLPKPGQERRIDLPTIGVMTVERAAEAGLAGIAIAAGAALILDRELVAHHADALGLFVYGFSKDGA